MRAGNLVLIFSLLLNCIVDLKYESISLTINKMPKTKEFLNSEDDLSSNDEAVSFKHIILKNEFK